MDLLLHEYESPSIITDAQNFSDVNGQLIWTIRGTMGLIVSISLIVFLVLIIKPETLELIREKLERFLRSPRFNSAKN